MSGANPPTDLGRGLFLLDSIALVGTLCERSHNAVLVSGFFNDAGGGKDDAGIAGLALLQGIDVPACAYAHESARIGEAADGLANGVISHLNTAALALGLRRGVRVREAVDALMPGGDRQDPTDV